MPPEFVRAQIDAVLGDIGADAAKTGMLVSAPIIVEVARAMRDHRIERLVVDPVMVAQSGVPLLESDGRDALLRELIPLAALVTPNVHEASALTGAPVTSEAEMRAAARLLIDRGARAVLIKGGHLSGNDAIDLFDDGHHVRELRAPRLATVHTHGTGCQLSAAITAQLARGHTLDAAIATAKRFITAAIRAGLALGSGHGPANPLAWLDELR